MGRRAWTIVAAWLLMSVAARAETLSDARRALADERYAEAADILRPLASDDPTAAYFLAFLRQRGLGGAADAAAARQLYTQAAQAGVTAAAFNLAGMLQAGQGGPVDEADARRWLNQAADDDYLPALRALARLATTGGGLGYDEPDLRAAAEYHLRAAQAGSVEDARAAMALHGPDGAMVDNQLWFRAALAAALAGDESAYWPLYQAYKSGRGTAANIALALPWLRKAAEARVPAALRELAELSEEGVVVQRDQELALALYADAADLGEPESLMRMADAYARGAGVPMDLDQALFYLNEAFRVGRAEAGVSLGRIYLAGRLEGVENLPFAVSWFDAARQLLPPGPARAEAEALYRSTLARLNDEESRSAAQRLAEQHLTTFGGVAAGERP